MSRSVVAPKWTGVIGSMRDGPRHDARAFSPTADLLQHANVEPAMLRCVSRNAVLLLLVAAPGACRESRPVRGRVISAAELSLWCVSRVESERFSVPFQRHGDTWFREPAPGADLMSFDVRRAWTTSAQDGLRAVVVLPVLGHYWEGVRGWVSERAGLLGQFALAGVPVGETFTIVEGFSGHLTIPTASREEADRLLQHLREYVGM